MKTKTRIVTLDDHPVIQHALALELTWHPDFDLLAQPTTLAAWEDHRLRHGDPDVLVTDLSFRGAECEDGLRFLRRLRHLCPLLRVVVLSEYASPALIRGAFGLGVWAFIGKGDTLSCVIAGLRATLRRERYLSDALRPRFEHAQSRLPPGVRAARLTARERDVLHFYAGGADIREVAARMARNVKTITALRGNAMRKLCLGSDAELFEYVSLGGCEGWLDGRSSDAHDAALPLPSDLPSFRVRPLDPVPNARD
ncbi:response regulator transcription factor [Robbsia sp. KACC 23696]|uniref:response regulator transcription factor n=1 Tax=Robbsia sp. KACC 23696 TaxID=3149231 RepID=UPI00325AB388